MKGKDKSDPEVANFRVFPSTVNGVVGTSRSRFDVLGNEEQTVQHRHEDVHVFMEKLVQIMVRMH